MTNKILVFAMICTVFISCETPKLTTRNLNPQQTNRMAQAIFSKYELLKQDKSAQFLYYGLLVTIIELDSSFQVVKQQPKSNFKTFSIYNKAREITSSGSLFYDIETGITITYGSDGSILSQTNEDAVYPFSVNSLISKLRSDFHINIAAVNPDISVDRFIDDDSNHTPTYVILVKKESFTFRKIRINGITGAVSSDEVIFAQE